MSSILQANGIVFNDTNIEFEVLKYTLRVGKVVAQGHVPDNRRRVRDSVSGYN